jgi:membrane-bound serine protease (ClpP class)
MPHMPPLMRFAALLALVLALLAMAYQAQGQESRQGRVTVAHLQGAIGVASAMHVCNVIEDSARDGSELVLIRIDTPGGLLSSTRDLIQCMLGSQRPIVVYVAPSGARAASAGTYIAQAAHIAAMTPGTHIGAATPVALGPGGTPRQPLDPNKQREEPRGPGPQTAAEQKAVNDAVAYLKGLAQLRGRNGEWAEKAVREAATLTASEALNEKVIDVIADDIPALLRQIDGRVVQIAGKDIRLATAGATQVSAEPDWRLRLLGVISDPNIAFILLMIGAYGLLLEFWSPGAIVPGVIGGISLLLAMIALSMLPLSYGALALILLGLALMLAEAFAPGFGVLGIGGLVAFVVGAAFLFDPRGADFDLRLAWPVILGAAASTALLSAGLLASAWHIRGRKPVSGAEEMIGLGARVVWWDGETGEVRVHGEVWRARGGDKTIAFAEGDHVRVLGRDGLTLIVEATRT